MKHNQQGIAHVAFIMVIIVVFALSGMYYLVSTKAATPYSATVYEAQKIMAKFSLPSGPADGIQGAQTRRGLCAFRHISGMTVTRNTLDSATLTKLRDFNKRYTSLGAIPAPANNGYNTYLVAEKTCQTMIYVVRNTTKAANFYKKVYPISTGAASCVKKDGRTGSCETPSGNYMLGKTNKGWICSSAYPESCVDNKDTDGRFGYIKNYADKPAGYGNMYNFRNFKDFVYGVHGSKSVPTYPASHGCIRVTLADSDWMYDNVGNYGSVPLTVKGLYRP
jgi:hypothetical protein